MGEKISVIVPVYNTAAYLEECAQSVLEQSYPHVELILIDDGSTDGSLELCEQLCKRDQRVQLLRQEHQGVSAARNRGMEAAGGEYLFFLDSDDAIHLRLLETLLELAKSTGAAVAMENYRRTESASFSSQAVDGSGETIYMKNFLEPLLAETKTFCAIGGKLLRRSIVEGIRFDPELSHGEDTKFLYQLAADGADGILLQRDWYFYRIHGENAIQTVSAAAYQSRYACLVYMQEQEERRGRTENGTQLAKQMADNLLKWYRLSRETSNRELQKCLKGLLAAERKHGRFARFSRRYRAKIWLALYGYPLYLPIHKCLSRLWHWKKREKGWK